MKREWLRYCGNQLSPAFHDVVHSQIRISQPRRVCWHDTDWRAHRKSTYIYPKAHLTKHGHQHFTDDMNTCKKDSFTSFFFFLNGGKYCHLQQLVTAKLFATSRLSMWGVSLNSEVPNWTIPIRNALYSWSAPLGNSPPEIDRNRLSIKCAQFSI